MMKTPTATNQRRQYDHNGDRNGAEETFSKFPHYASGLNDAAEAAIREQPLADIGHAAISEIVTASFTSLNGHDRANFQSSLAGLRVERKALEERRIALEADQQWLPHETSSSIAGAGPQPGDEGGADAKEFSIREQLYLRDGRSLPAMACFGFAIVVTAVDWSLGYGFCRPTILNNGGAAWEAMVCGFPFATLPLGVEWLVSLRNGGTGAQSTLRHAGRLLVGCGALYGLSFAMDFALSTEAAAPWYNLISPFLPMVRLLAQLGVGSSVAFIAIIKGRTIAHRSRAEKVRAALDDIIRAITKLDSSEQQEIGRMAVYEASLKSHILTAQADCRKHHVQHF